MCAYMSVVLGRLEAGDISISDSRLSFPMHETEVTCTYSRPTEPKPVAVPEA